MLHNFIAGAALVVALLLEFALLGSLVTDGALAQTPLLWLGLHSVAAVISAVCAAYFLKPLMPQSNRNLVMYCVPLCLAIPLAGAVGCLAAMAYGIFYANNRHDQYVYWQFTKNADLPFTAPLQRKVGRLDSRGFIEQIEYSKDNDELYRKVLAVSNIQNSLSVAALKAAVKHSDDRIRLTAYQTLDKKVTVLNKQIQDLEASARNQDTTDQSNTWLQIASNYWELLTLEKDEPIAREQLLKKASEAAINSIRIMPTNRNSHFILGRISLLQNKERIAAVAFDRAMALGMPEDKAMPYRAEAAFIARDFKTVKKSLSSIDPAYKVYPPLCHLAGYWS